MQSVMQDYSFLQDMAVVMVIAGVVTLLFHRLKQPVILGYLLAGFLTHRHHIGRLDLVGSNIHGLAVHQDRLVADQLAGLGAGGTKTHPVHDVVQATLQQLQQVFTR